MTLKEPEVRAEVAEPEVRAEVIDPEVRAEVGAEVTEPEVRAEVLRPEVGAGVLRPEAGAEVLTGRGRGNMKKWMEVMVATEVLKERVIREYKDLITGEEKVLTAIDTGEAVDVNYL